MKNDRFVIRFPDGAFNWGPDDKNGFPAQLSKATVYPTKAAAEAKAVDLGEVEIVPLSQAAA